MRSAILAGLILVVLAAGVLGWIMRPQHAPIGSQAFAAYSAPTPSPTPIPEPTGSADPSICARGTHEAGYAFGSLLAEELREAQSALTGHRYKLAVGLARDGETRLAICGARVGSDAPQIEVFQAKFQLIEAESYIGYGDSRASVTLGAAEATASSAEHSIDADASTKQMAHQITEQIAHDLAALTQ